MAYESTRERRHGTVVRERPAHERDSFVRRVISALFATALGVLAFIGLLVVLAIILLFVIF